MCLGVICNSVAYWVLVAANAVVVGLALAFIAVFLVRYHRRKERLGFAYLMDDVRWTVKAVLVYPLVCFVAGTSIYVAYARAWSADVDESTIEGTADKGIVFISLFLRVLFVWVDRNLTPTVPLPLAV